MNRAKIFIVFTFLLAFAVCVSAQSVQFPNELKGYRFFGDGKLKGVKLAVSTKEDVKKIFGENCEDYCDYNQNWRISFTYFDNITKGFKDDKDHLVPDSKYIGKLYSIALRPKEKNISFAKVIFSAKFQKINSYSAGHDGRGGGTNTSYYTYKDKHGLSYEIFDRITLTTVKEPSKTHKGDLLSIEYEIPDDIEEKMFVKQK